MKKIWKIQYYKQEIGESPIFEFIEELPEKAQAKLINTLSFLTEYGILLREPHVKKVAGTRLWELRILGQDNLRILYIAITGKNFLLLHAFNKKKQKTDKREINTALARLRDYRSRAVK